PFKVNGFLGYNDQPGNKVWVAPALGYNLYDGFMLGGLLHNLSVPASRFQFAIAPLFGFKSQELSGTGFINYDVYLKDKKIKGLNFHLKGKSFEQYSHSRDHYNGLRYYKIAPSVTLNFAKKTFTDPVDRLLKISVYGIGE